ncbi:MAG: nicotinate phosphoribosyltransferase, partial [Terriglobia bacterium]
MTKLTAGTALLTDLYELTMAAGYFERRLDCRATFELFVRVLPPERAFLLACGLESALEYLENFRFTEEEVRFLREQPVFKAIGGDFFDYLRNLRFTGDVSAVPEGTVVFAEEPLLQVTAPIAEAQIVETYLLSVLSFETLVATKAARVVRGAEGKAVLEFGARRAHGPEAGVLAARAAYVGGCQATSNVLAGSLFGIPLAGTAAHSWTQAFPSERESFIALLDSFPDSAILLIDTYDTVPGAETAASLGRKVSGVRLDSGDLLQKSRQVRRILDSQHHHETQIVASGDLNEFKIAELVGAGAPIDSFGVGTEIVTSKDAPALSVVYKLVETEQAGRVEYKTKFSEEKTYLPGRKQVFRFAVRGRLHHDLIARAGECYPSAAPLLEPVMRGGRRIGPRPALEAVRARARESIMRLPVEYQALESAPRYPVQKSDAIERLLEDLRTSHFAE